MGLRGSPLHVTEILEDAWHRAGASNETLVTLKEVDRRCGSQFGRGSLDDTLRCGALRCLLGLVEGSTGSKNYVFKAALLFDLSAESTTSDQLPLTCAAIARIVVKSEFTLNGRSLPLLSERCPGWARIKAFADWLQTFDIKPMEMNHLMLCRHEQAILKALNFQVGYPCLEQWFYVLNCRMKLLSGGYETSDQFEYGKPPFNAALAIMMAHRATELSQGAVALGLFLLSFVHAGHLSLKELKPVQLPDEEWAELCSESRLGGLSEGCAHPTEEFSTGIFDMLVVAVQEEAEELRNQAYHAVKSVVEALRWIESRHGTS